MKAKILHLTVFITFTFIVIQIPKTKAQNTTNYFNCRTNYYTIPKEWKKDTSSYTYWKEGWSVEYKDSQNNLLMLYCHGMSNYNVITNDSGEYKIDTFAYNGFNFFHYVDNIVVNKEPTKLEMIQFIDYRHEIEFIIAYTNARKEEYTEILFSIIRSGY